MNAVLFDLDGTLLDTAPDFIAAMDQLLEENHQPKLSKPISELKASVSQGGHGMLTDWYGIDCNDPKLDALLHRFLVLYAEQNHQATQPFPGIVPLIEVLAERHIPWGIVTNKPERFTHALLKTQILPPANCVVSGDTLAKKKPDPEPLWHACAQLSVKPEHCIYVGDAERDIIAGSHAGMATITAMFGYIPDLQTARQWPATYQAYDGHELEQYIRSWLQTQ